jgi:uncharacterized membrane protein AbrB (regulator of aidB expression)
MTGFASTRRLVAAVVTAWLLGGASALACPVCFRFEESPVTDGIKAAGLVLVGVTAGVLTGFGVFAVRFVRRARLGTGDVR